MNLFAPDMLTQAEDRHAEMLERKETARDKAKADLIGEFMACATMPLLTSVFHPTTANRLARTPFLDEFGDGLSWSKNRHLLGRVVSILMRDEGGREVVKTLAEQYADDWADEVAQ